MCVYYVLILSNCNLFVCVLNLTFHISRQIVVLIMGVFRKKNINASNILKRGLHL